MTTVLSLKVMSKEDISKRWRECKDVPNDISKKRQPKGCVMMNSANKKPESFGKNQLGNVYNGIACVDKDNQHVYFEGDVVIVLDVQGVSVSPYVVGGCYYLPRRGNKASIEGFGLMLLPLCLEMEKETMLWRGTKQVIREDKPRQMDWTAITSTTMFFLAKDLGFKQLMCVYILDWPIIRRPKAAALEFCPPGTQAGVQDILPIVKNLTKKAQKNAVERQTHVHEAD
jgi:hypothetical protein